MRLKISVSIEHDVRVVAVGKPHRGPLSLLIDCPFDRAGRVGRRVVERAGDRFSLLAPMFSNDLGVSFEGEKSRSRRISFRNEHLRLFVDTTYPTPTREMPVSAAGTSGRAR